MAAASDRHENKGRARKPESTPKGSIDRPKHIENKKQRRSDASDAFERDSEDHTDTDHMQMDARAFLEACVQNAYVYRVRPEAGTAHGFHRSATLGYA